MMKRKSQMTIFIIIGVIMLLSGALVAYIKTIGTEPIKKVADDQKSEISIYVSSCIKQTTEEALLLVGSQGGYIKHQEGDKAQAIFDPLNSPYLSMYNGKLLISYWYYQDETGLDESGMPSLTKNYDGDNSIQSQLEGYISENVEKCINGFEPFKKEAYIIKIRNRPKAQVLFTDSKVIVELNYPVEFSRGEQIENYETFSAEIQVRLKKIYTLAKEIRDYEIKNVFLERQTKNFINAYSLVDNDYLPPMYGGMTFEKCTDKVFWMYPDVEKDFKEMIAANIPYMRIENTDYSPLLLTEPNAENLTSQDMQVMQGVMKGMVKKVSDNNYPFIRADFTYDEDFPIELDLGTKGILEPNSFDVDLIFSQYCLMEYKFFYNIKYPILVTLIDSKSMIDNQQFVFQYPMMVVIKDNFPRVRYSEVFGNAEQIGEKSYQCSEEQRLSGPVVVKVLDDQNKPIEKARVMFQCGPSVVVNYDVNGTPLNINTFADKCFMGMTESTGTLNINFPPCMGAGTITIDHDSYVGTSEVIGNVYEGRGFNKTYNLYRVVEKDIKISKFFVKPPILAGTNMVDDSPGIIIGAGGEVVGCNIKSDSAPLQEHENVLVRLRRISEDGGKLSGQPFLLYNPTKKNTLKLAPGKYNVDMMLIRNERYKGEMTIMRNSEYKYIKGSIASDSKTIYYPEEDVEIPTIFSGGTEFVWELKPEDLYAPGEIRFFIIDEGAPKFVEHVGRPVDDRNSCTLINWDIMQPKFEMGGTG